MNAVNKLHDFREQTGFCSGEQLREFTSGAKINGQEAYEFVCYTTQAAAWNDGGNWERYDGVEAQARSLFKPRNTQAVEVRYRELRARYGK